MSDGGRRGRPRKEIIAPKAFSFRINDPSQDIHLLVGHSYDRPLASRSAGTLDIKDSADAVEFVATIASALETASWVQDALSALDAGLIGGISPGFRLPPERAVKKPETIEEEPIDPENGMHGAIIRTVNDALLYEMSLVTVPAYDETQIEARNWNARACDEAPHAGMRRALERWRA
ncbi:hypothetical protein B1812_07395 [Methylocystis bryophila]|uniref:Prohead serine protease domain-containing protein n=1 Tax=Methylocystis bryophila TaxID=655015 RepID=A0A1W6MTN1_9HYPH|nr:hypothetical protein B1812_07395 [Methylocystis bryophila]